MGPIPELAQHCSIAADHFCLEIGKIRPFLGLTNKLFIFYSHKNMEWAAHGMDAVKFRGWHFGYQTHIAMIFCYSSNRVY